MEINNIKINNRFKMEITVEKSAEYISVEEYWIFYVEDGDIIDSCRSTSVRQEDGKWRQVKGTTSIDPENLPQDVEKVVYEQLGWEL